MSPDPDRRLLRPDGSEVDDSENVTERGLERSVEEEKYVPVIVKRTDEARRHPDDVLQAAIREGREQLERRPISLFLSAVAGGLILGFTAMAVAVAHQTTAELDSPAIERIVRALVYPLGFVMCIMSGTQLFTEHTATAVYPVLDKRASAKRLLRLWGLVLAGNLTGALASAALLGAAEPVIGASEGYRAVGEHLLQFGTFPLLMSALLAGWLMALGAWLTLSTPPTIAQIASIYMVTFLIGFGGLHHSIAGAAEMFAAMFVAGGISPIGASGFIACAVLGNLIGGSFFVAVLNYGHIRRSQTVGGS